MKIEYSFIRYIPVAGAISSATSSDTPWLYKVSRLVITHSIYERVLSACKYKLASYKAMKATGIMILLYGVGGEPGRGQKPYKAV